MLKYLISAIAFASILVYTNAECVNCDSRHDINCLYDNMLSTNCTPWDNQCFVRIDDDGSTVRGCLNSLSGPEQFQCTGQNCMSCTNLRIGTGFHPGCNNVIFPEHRIRCHVCNSTTNLRDCLGEQTSPATICSRFVDGDSCFIMRRGDSFARGCVSDEPVCLQENACYTCIGEGCNFANVTSIELPEAPIGGNSANTISAISFIAFALCAILLMRNN
uniref:DUF753 domain-containing protein n=1 Tax=Lutzomyia longipalpis TaxID=7200 RepID=A0A1B0CLA0_LUTLO